MREAWRKQNYGEFYPFSGSISSDGEIVHQGAYDGNEFPDKREIFELLAKGLRADADRGAIRASAIVSDVTVTLSSSPKKQDAIRISLEHHGGYAAEVLLPY